MRNPAVALLTVTACVLTTSAPFVRARQAPEVTGELRQWHRVTLTFEGPEADEEGEANPFLDYRLQVTFRQGDRSYMIPGFFAADGDAAETGATGGNKWRVHFCPDRTGTWQYEVSFRRGREVAVSDDPEAGAPVSPPDGIRGVLEIAPSDKKGDDHRAKGRLQYVGERYLKFAGTGEYFLKQGADAPENFLAYADFDGPFKTDGHKDHLIKTWEPHVRDWRAGDPVWQGDKGKGMIGAVNYLAGEGMNAISFLTLNIGGDDRNVFPYLDYDERYRMDVSRLAQWEIVFSHMDRRGIYLHFKTQETENDHLLDGGDVGVQRRLYYRELIARFAHHLALNWNLGEENTQSTAQRRAMTEYFWEHDPYRNHIVIHNGKSPADLLGDKSKLTGFSLQTNHSDFRSVHRRVAEWVRRSAEAGKPWVVACDEPGDAGHALLPDADNPEHDNARRNALWGTLMAGGAGNEWYFGYRHAHSDLTCEDWRSRDLWWDQCRIALRFFEEHVPFWALAPADDMTPAGGDYCLADPGQFYVIYLPGGGPAEVGLGSGTYSVAWFNPRTGGELLTGDVETVEGPGTIGIGEPPAEPGKDWAALVRLTEGDGSGVPDVVPGRDTRGPTRCQSANGGP